MCRTDAASEAKRAADLRTFFRASCALALDVRVDHVRIEIVAYRVTYVIPTGYT